MGRQPDLPAPGPVQPGTLCTASGFAVRPVQHRAICTRSSSTAPYRGQASLAVMLTASRSRHVRWKAGSRSAWCAISHAAEAARRPTSAWPADKRGPARLPDAPTRRCAAARRPDPVCGDPPVQARSYGAPALLECLAGSASLGGSVFRAVTVPREVPTSARRLPAAPARCPGGCASMAARPAGRCYGCACRISPNGGAADGVCW